MIFVRRTQVHQGLQLYQVNQNLSTHYEITTQRSAQANKIRTHSRLFAHTKPEISFLKSY